MGFPSTPEPFGLIFPNHSLPELNNKMLSGFEYIYAIDGNNIFLGGEKGFYHINYEKYKRQIQKFNNYN